MSTTHLLDRPSSYTRYDKEDIAHGIERLAQQLKLAFSATESLDIPKSYTDIDQVVIAGMGGSTLAAHMLETAGAHALKKCVHIVRDYSLPSWVGKRTMVLLTSYSGETEEVLSAAKDAKYKRAKCMVICAGGTLEKMAKKEGWPLYRFEPGDLAKQPRLALGFSFAGMMGMLHTAGVLVCRAKERASMISAMADVVDHCALDVPEEEENPAKQIASALHGKPVLFVGSEHLVGNVHVFANQLNETAKQFAHFVELPELNHHLMEGLRFPKSIFSKFCVLMVKSKHYHAQTRKRYELSAELFEKQGAQVVEYEALGVSRFEEASEVLQFSSFVSYYLGIKNKINPKENPYVDWFKKELAKHG